MCFVQVSLSFHVLDKLVTEGKGKHVRTTKPFSVRQCFSDSDAYFSISVSKLRQICLMETFYLIFSVFSSVLKTKS